jgi:hypothetical protein
LPGALLALSGCVDPAGDLDDFRDRHGRTHATAGTSGSAGAAGAAGAGGAGGGSGCVVPEPEEMAGEALFAISSTLGPTKPVVIWTDVSAVKENDGVRISFEAQALKACDRKTKVGDPLPPGDYFIGPDGRFDAALGPQTTHGDANPILPGTPIESSPVLHGQVCSVRTPEDPDAVIEFSCGTLTGELLQPVQGTLDGSTFTFTRILDPENYPEVTINCARDPADPPSGC